MDAAAHPLLAVEKQVGVGHERRPFAAGGQVGGAEVVDDRHPQRLGEPAGLAQLPGDPGWLVPDGLPRERGQLDAPPEGRGRLGVEAAEVVVQLRQVARAQDAVLLGLAHPGEEALGVGNAPALQRFVAHLRRTPLEPHPHQVRAVGAGAAHDAQDDHGSARSSATKS